MTNKHAVLLLVSALLSGCAMMGLRPFEQVEREMNENPVRATFVVPPPCDYVDAPRAVSAVVGRWTAVGSTDWAVCSSYCFPARRFHVDWKRTFAFSSDGSYVKADTVNGWPFRETGRWSYSDGLLVLDCESPAKRRHECRLHWIDGDTFDHRLEGHEFTGGKNTSTEASYDRNGCRHETCRTCEGRTGTISAAVSSPLRYRRSDGDAGGVAPSGRIEPTNPPQVQEGSRAASSMVEIDSIPL